MNVQKSDNASGSQPKQCWNRWKKMIIFRKALEGQNSLKPTCCDDERCTYCNDITKRQLYPSFKINNIINHNCNYLELVMITRDKYDKWLQVKCFIKIFCSAYIKSNTGDIWKFAHVKVYLRDNTCGCDCRKWKCWQCAALFVQSGTGASEDLASSCQSSVQDSLLNHGHISSYKWGWI